MLTPRMTKYIKHKPTPKQAAFLLLPHLEAFYGGQAGGGKSDALLMAALQYVDKPGYNAILLRRTYTDLKLPEALLDRAASWLNGTDARWVANKAMWLFPSGATLSFGYLDTQRSMDRYQSAAFQFIGLDEVTQFYENQFLYMFSRLRRLADLDVPLRMRSAGNPGGVGHQWVKARYVKPRNLARPFIPAALDENPFIDQVSYRESLSRLGALERSWYEYGNWDATVAGTIAKREWFPVVEQAPANVTGRVRGWDLAATEKKMTSDDPDYTVGTKMSVDSDGVYYVEHVVRGRYGAGAIERVVKQTAVADGRKVRIRIEEEGGASGKLYVGMLTKLLAGWVVSGKRSSGDKVQRAMPFISQAEAGNVRLVRGVWNEAWLDEVCGVPFVTHDDQWDSASIAFEALQEYAGVREMDPGEMLDSMSNRWSLDSGMMLS
jgi:predicted phage terminase large subunit-like protein